VRHWQARWTGKLDVVVDAAQMRVDQHTSISHLDDGWMVIVTGSKFYAGPPFSGAILLPAAPARSLASTRVADSGLFAYVHELSVPAELVDLRRCARRGANVGLTLRWKAALSEMQAFHSVSTSIRDEILRHFARRMLEAIAESPSAELVPSPYTGFVDDDQRGLDDLPTIFTFLVKDDSGMSLDMETARAIQRLLPEDLAARLPAAATAEERSLAGRSFQVGQPVAVGVGPFECGALRVAVGAPTISRIVFDTTRGRSWRERLDREVADAADAIAKVVLLAKYWSEIDAEPSR
jgi:hypothetical protein